jgi:hypothetical protein
MKERIIFKTKVNILAEFIIDHIGRENNQENRNHLIAKICREFKTLYPQYVDADGRISDGIEIQTFII